MAEPSALGLGQMMIDALSRQTSAQGELDQTDKEHQALINQPLGAQAAIPGARGGLDLLLPLLLSASSSALSGNQRSAATTQQALASESADRDEALKRNEQQKVQEAFHRRQSLLELKAQEHGKRYDMLNASGQYVKALEQLDFTIKAEKEREKERQTWEEKRLGLEHNNRMSEIGAQVQGAKDAATIRASNTGIPYVDAFNSFESLITRRRAEQVDLIMAGRGNDKEKKKKIAVFDKDIMFMRQAALAKPFPDEPAQFFAARAKQADFPPEQALALMNQHYPGQDNKAFFEEAKAPKPKGNESMPKMPKAVTDFLQDPKVRELLNSLLPFNVGSGSTRVRSGGGGSF